MITQRHILAVEMHSTFQIRIVSRESRQGERISADVSLIKQPIKMQRVLYTRSASKESTCEADLSVDFTLALESIVHFYSSM